MIRMTLADINLSIDSELWTITESFNDFLSAFTAADLECHVVFSEEKFPVLLESQRIFSSDMQTAYRDNNTIYILYHNAQFPLYIAAEDNWTRNYIYISKASHEPDNIYNANAVRFVVSSAIKTIFVNALSDSNGILVHSATIDFRGKGVMFAAPSGTGKSTHAHLWREKYQVPIVDGDSAACRILDGKPFIFGLPWSGSSGEYLNARLPLSAIVFLEQATKNSIQKLNLAEAAVRLYANSFLFSWDEKAADRLLHTVTDIAGGTNCYMLKCRPDFEAVELVKKCLDES